jgi:hypothetical protein
METDRRPMPIIDAIKGRWDPVKVLGTKVIWKCNHMKIRWNRRK